MTNGRDRDFYEGQGADALQSGHAFQCSEDSVVDAVIGMVHEYINEFDVLLDVGCGANLTYDIAITDEGKSVVGVDFTMNFLRRAPRGHACISFAQADALRLPFRNGSFRAVICSETIEHIPDDSAALAEIARVLRPKGLLFVTVPNLWNAARIIQMLKTRDLTLKLMEGHVREYSPRQFKKLLSNSFTIERWVPVGFGWTGKYGGTIERLIHLGVLRRFCKSVAFVARKR